MVQNMFLLSIFTFILSQRTKCPLDIQNLSRILSQRCCGKILGLDNILHIPLPTLQTDHIMIIHLEKSSRVFLEPHIHGETLTIIPILLHLNRSIALFILNDHNIICFLGGFARAIEA